MPIPVAFPYPSTTAGLELDVGMLDVIDSFPIGVGPTSVRLDEEVVAIKEKTADVAVAIDMVVATDFWSENIES